MEILIYADWMSLGGPHFMGSLSVTHTKGREVFSFAYDPEWLRNGPSQTLDPDLLFYPGPQYLPIQKKNFGIFLDSSPDRWGRVLMDRRESIHAKMEQRKRKTLFEEDYLLGVYDAQRMGAIRFKKNASGPFVHDDQAMASTPWTSLRELEHASLELEGDSITDNEALKWIDLLLAPGASLGGARPKAGVKDEHGNLWICKFPSLNDRTDVGAWEMVAYELAKNAGLDTAEGKLVRYGSRHHSFLSKRFDRTQAGARVHFASAMTLLGKTDGEPGTSYIDLAEFIMRQGVRVQKDLEELWRRIVFDISIKNTDDHLRNHGFLFGNNGWKLSPAYDMNPVFNGKGLTLNISESSNSLDLDLALSVAKFFRLTDKKANAILKKVKKAVSGWPGLASRLKLPRTELDFMAQAFEVSETLS
jgi:serine/threonine-protein kinase HipA